MSWGSNYRKAILTALQQDKDFTWPDGYEVFPSHMVTDELDRKAVLVFRGCTIGNIWMVEFIQELLQREISLHFLLFSTSR